jgi:hypothetical protein
MEEVGVVILTHNSKKFLNHLIPSVLNQSYKNYKIYVLDNSSDDGTPDIVERNYPQISIIRLKKDYYFAIALNYAAKKLNHKYLAFLNDDTYVNSFWLEGLVRSIETDDKVVIANSKSMVWSNPQIIDSAGGKLTIMGGGYNIGLLERDSAEFNTEKYIGAAVASSVLVKRELFLKVGGFDSNFIMNIEDTDFCWRAWLFGLKVIFSPKSVIFHHQSYSWEKESTYLKGYFNIRNRYLTLLKNADSQILLISLSISSLFNILYLVKNPSRLKCRAFIDAISYIWKNKKRVLTQRKDIQSKRTISFYNLMKKGFFSNFQESINRIFLRR